METPEERIKSLSASQETKNFALEVYAKLETLPNFERPYIFGSGGEIPPSDYVLFCWERHFQKELNLRIEKNALTLQVDYQEDSFEVKAQINEASFAVMAFLSADTK